MAFEELSTSAVAFETIVVDNTVGGVRCTVALVSPTDGSPSITRAIFGPLEGAQIRFRYDSGAPTTTVGHILEVGQTLTLTGYSDIINFRAIRTGAASGALPATYER